MRFSVGTREGLVLGFMKSMGANIVKKGGSAFPLPTKVGGGMCDLYGKRRYI